MMFKRFFTFLLVLPFTILSVFASEEQEEISGFFPQKFSTIQIEELISAGKCTDNYKIYTIEGKDHEVLKSYSPSFVQVYTKYMNPLEERVQFEKANYQTISDHKVELFPGYEEVGLLKTLTGKYKIQGSYGTYSSSAEISITGTYDIFRLILSNEKFNENGLCLHRLKALDGNFTSETYEAHRLNQTLSKLFYVRKALQQPDKYSLVYDDIAEELGRKWFVEHMKVHEISDQVCIAVLLKSKDIDKNLVSLTPQFYAETLNVLRDEIYSLLGVDKTLLQTMYEGVGSKKIEMEYARVLESQSSRS